MVLFGAVARATVLLLPCCWTTTGMPSIHEIGQFQKVAADDYILLAGPAPNGWQTESDVRTE